MQIEKPNFVTFFSRYAGSIIGIALVVGALFPYTAFAFFNAPAGAAANVFSVGTLSYTLNKNALGATLTQQATSTVSFTTANTGDIAPQYQLSAQKGACSNAFYNGLHISVRQGSTIYTGTFPTLMATSSQSGTWQISIGAGSAIALPNDKCQIKLHLSAWQPQFTSATAGGFTASTTIPLTITASGYLGRTVVLNEILPNPNTASTSPPYANQEFIELYNDASAPVNVTSWKISEMSDSSNEDFHTIVATSTSSGRMVPASGSSITIAAHGWLALIFSGQDSYLNNGGDTVRLYDNNNVLRDEFKYVSSTKGKSDGRFPDGSGVWVDPMPTPGEPNTDAPFVPDLSQVITNINNTYMPDIATTTATTTAKTVATTTPSVVGGTASSTPSVATSTQSEASTTQMMATTTETHIVAALVASSGDASSTPDIATTTSPVVGAAASSTPSVATSSPTINIATFVLASSTNQASTTADIAGATPLASSTPATPPAPPTIIDTASTSPEKL